METSPEDFARLVNNAASFVKGAAITAVLLGGAATAVYAIRKNSQKTTDDHVDVPELKDKSYAN